MATVEEAITRIKRRLSRRNDSTLDAIILDELNATKEFLEEQPRLPWWLVTAENKDFVESIDLTTLSSSFLKIHDDLGVRVNLLADFDPAEEEQYQPLPRFVSEADLKSRHPGQASLPRGWSEVDGSLVLRPAPDGSVSPTNRIRIRYYYRSPAITAGAHVWLTNAATLMIAHTGLEVAQGLRDQVAMQYFGPKRLEAWQAYTKSLTAREMSGLELSMGGED